MERRGRVHPLYSGIECHPGGLAELPHRLRPGRALENYAILGDHNEGTPSYKGDKALLRAIEVLESVREEGRDKAEWNMRMAYGYQYLHGQEEEAIPYAQRWAELDPEDEDARW